jgi:hypothetical protein
VVTTSFVEYVGASDDGDRAQTASFSTGGA